VDVVVGFGGYVSSPAYAAARRAGIPIVVHEANARPGLANVRGARHAAAVGVTFPGTPLRGAEVVGMPLRREIVTLDRAATRAEGAAFFGLDPNLPTLLVFGGSLGARRLNDAFAGAGRAVRDAGWQLLHVTGERSVLADAVDSASVDPGWVVQRYIDRMDLAFAVADAVVSRSGSATVSELSALGIPAIYVPYAVGNGEQRLNAASAVAGGAARIIPDDEFTAERVRTEVAPLLAAGMAPGTVLDAMRRAAADVGIRTGTENLIALIRRARRD
jgi:UDP-N-acetylglucosamine--N-acetylmuramyl-(pentapeptide) pyrophosphoryl-undecaprenol N-acetylglucosamine transferase